MTGTAGDDLPAIPLDRPAAERRVRAAASGRVQYRRPHQADVDKVLADHPDAADLHRLTHGPGAAT